MGVHFFPQAWRIDRPTTAKRKFAKHFESPGKRP
jgi:hypothetical protein